MAVDYDHFDEVKIRDGIVERRYYKDGQLVMTERETVSARPHPQFYIVDKSDRCDIKRRPDDPDWPEVIS